MDDLKKEIMAEKELVIRTLAFLDEALKREEKTVVELAGIATFLQNVYNGIENVIKRIFKHKGIPIPESESYHKDLLSVSVEQKIITIELMAELDRYRAFRHFFVHTYVVRLEEEKLIPLALDIKRVWKLFESEVNKVV